MSQELLYNKNKPYKDINEEVGYPFQSLMNVGAVKLFTGVPAEKNHV